MATTFIGSAATTYLSGSAEIKQSIFTIENSGSESPVIVKIRRMVTQAPESFTITNWAMPLFRSYRLTSLPTGGTILDKTPFDTLSGSNASVIVRSSCSVGNGLNGIISTPITSSLPEGPVWQQYCNKSLCVLKNQWRYLDNNNLPLLVNNNPFILRANEAIGIEVEGFVSTQNPVTARYFVQCAWEEETI